MPVLLKLYEPWLIPPKFRRPFVAAVLPLAATVTGYRFQLKLAAGSVYDFNRQVLPPSLVYVISLPPIPN